MPILMSGVNALYESGLDNLIQALLNRRAVIVGSGAGAACQVIAHAVPDLGVRVGAGTIQGDLAGAPVRVPVAQTDLGINPNASGQARVDLVSVNFTTGVPAVTQGAPAAAPKPPSMPVTDILLGYVSVPSGAANIQNANIIDRRLFLPTWEDPTALLAAAANPNLILNSDGGRRTVFGLAMPETFADLLGTTKIDAGAAGAVAGNVFTQGAANNEYAWANGAFVWRDGRGSATFKAVAIAGIYELRWRIDATHYISAKQNNGNFTLVMANGGGPVVQTTFAQALTLNRWYWLEIDVQGTTATIKLYDTGGTVTGVTKASSTLLLTLNAVGLLAQTGAHVSITSDQATAQWGGGIAAGNGGVYVETWLSESHAITFGGTLGGQCIGYDEAADAGPLNFQWVFAAYIPAISRTMTVQQNGRDGSIVSAQTYTASYYEKTAGLGGAGVMIRGALVEQNSAQATQATTNIDDAAEAAYTRKFASVVTNAATRRFAWQFLINPAVSRTGTVRFGLAQLEQAAATSPWRAAPADDAPITYELVNISGGKATNGGTYTDMDSRDSAIDIFLPWDADVEAAAQAMFSNSAAANITVYNFSVDGADWEAASGGIFNAISPSINGGVALSMRARKRLAAGKHRIALRWKVTGGTSTQLADAGAGSPSLLAITAARGR